MPGRVTFSITVVLLPSTVVVVSLIAPVTSSFVISVVVPGAAVPSGVALSAGACVPPGCVELPGAALSAGTAVPSGAALCAGVLSGTGVYTAYGGITTCPGFFVGTEAPATSFAVPKTPGCA